MESADFEYGKNYELNIESHAGEGTLVTVHIGKKSLRTLQEQW